MTHLNYFLGSHYFSLYWLKSCWSFYGVQMMIKIIAEAGINHMGRFNDAVSLVCAAYNAGADAVKFQFYQTSTLVRDVPNRELLKSCEMSPLKWLFVKRSCDDLKIEMLASCFDGATVDFACNLGIPTIKVGSGELVNHGLLEYIGSKGKDLLLSTGMSTLAEVESAVMAYDFAAPSGEVSLLHCVSCYPTSFEDCNLRAIRTLKERMFCPVGFSDHTKGFDAALIAVGMGAEIIERHIMLAPGCPDEAVSLTPENFRGYVAAIRRAEKMMGDGIKKPVEAEMEMREKTRYRWHKETI